MGGHQSAAAETTTWLTPRFILDALGVYDLDPCAAPDPVLWPTAREHFVFPHQDGLKLPWRTPASDHPRIWLNPPYGTAVGTWLHRLANHGRGTALVFARTETDAFFEEVWSRADSLLFLRGRLFFHDAKGRRAQHNAGAPTVLAAYGPEDAERLLDSGLDGAPVALNRPVMLFMAMVRQPPAPLPVWREAIADALASLGGTARLVDLYTALERHPKVQDRPNWRAKVRQTVARMGLQQVGPATYTTPDLFATT
jgi:hypothetical protein